MTAEHSSYEELARARRKSDEYREEYAEARRAFLIGQAVRERRLALGLSQVELAAQLRLDPGEEQPVVVDHEHPDPTPAGPRRPGPHRACQLPPGRRHATLGMLSWTSVPASRSVTIVADPPERCIRPRIESAMPRRSGATESGSKPAPWSRTKAVTDSASTSR